MLKAVSSYLPHVIGIAVQFQLPVFDIPSDQDSFALPLCFEVTGHDTFGEVLYPRDVYDLIEFSLREAIRREQRMRICKNCGRYFAIARRSSAEYCERQ